MSSFPNDGSGGFASIYHLACRKLPRGVIVPAVVREAVSIGVLQNVVGHPAPRHVPQEVRGSSPLSLPLLPQELSTPCAASAAAVPAHQIMQRFRHVLGRGGLGCE